MEHHTLSRSREQLRVLVVDDEATSRKGLRDCMPWDSYGAVVVATAGDPRQAISLARDLRPDVVVTDIVMPQMSGLAMLGVMKAEDPGLQAILVSAHDDHTYVRAGMGLSAVDYLLKPIQGESLREALDRAARRIADRRDEEATNSDLWRRFRDSFDYVRDRFFRDLITGHILTRRELAERAREAEVKLPFETTYRLCAVTLRNVALRSFPEIVADGAWLFPFDDELLLITRQTALAVGVAILRERAVAVVHSVRGAEVGHLRGTPSAQSPLELAESYVALSGESLPAASLGPDLASPRDPDEPVPVVIARRVIEAEFANDVSISEIAARAGVSDSHLSHVFREATGRTVLSYLTDVRVSNAVSLLRDPRRRINEIAAAVGYRDPKYFGRVFRRAMGMRPSTYRRSLLSSSH